MPIRRTAVLTDIFLFHQVWWKLQRQQVWAVRAPQQHQQSTGGRLNRSRGHRGSARLSDTGCRHLLCTQVSGLFFQELAKFCKLQMGYIVLFWFVEAYRCPSCPLAGCWKPNSRANRTLSNNTGKYNPEYDLSPGVRWARWDGSPLHCWTR